MKAWYLTKNAAASEAFELREHAVPEPGAGQVRISVQAFGLNFADVMARQGLYREAPPLPCVIGYEVVGHVEMSGDGVTDFAPGDRVVAFTRFGGYAQQVVSDQRAVTKVPEDMANGVAVALATQYCTAWHASSELTNLFPGEKVLIHAAAGGVGTALVQIAKHRGCTVFGTAGSDEKLEYLRSQGVDHPINYRTQDFAAEVSRILGDDRLDVVFDAVGGKTYSKSRKLVGTAGRIVNYGASQRSGQKGGIFATLKLLWDFGLIVPVFQMMLSKSSLGVNMLKVADNKPHIIQRCLTEVVRLTGEGHLNPQVGGVFSATDLADAHHQLQHRKTTGKIVVEW